MTDEPQVVDGEETEEVVEGAAPVADAEATEEAAA